MAWGRLVLLGLVLLPVMVALPSERAAAEWTVGGTRESDGMPWYVDRSSIRRDSGHVWMWNLTNYNGVQVWEGKEFQSSVAQWEYDCAGRQQRVTIENGFSELNGRGEITYTVQGPRPWRPVEPGTIGEAKLQIACGR